MKIHLIFILTMIFISLSSSTKVDKVRNEFNDCYNKLEMDYTRNIYSSPQKITDTSFKSVKFYVIENENLKGENYEYRSNRFLVDNLKREKDKHQRVVFANYSDTIITVESYFVRGLFVIQEAQDSTGLWLPVEAYNKFLSCSTDAIDYFTINPKEYINMYVPRYCGEFETKVRLKFQTKNNIFYSNEFNGSVNYKQFDRTPLYGQNGNERASFLLKSEMKN